jgi:hypothetical protein
MKKETEEQKQKRIILVKEWKKKNKEIVKEYNKKYREEHKDYFIKKQKEFTLKNPEKIKEYHIKQYYNNDRFNDNLKSRRRLTSRLFCENNKEIRNNYQKKYAGNNPIKIKAQRLAQNILLKEKCDICGNNDELQRHHWDYNKPLLISTLCGNCHSIQHLKNKEIIL